MKLFFFIGVVIITSTVVSQEIVTLQECYDLASVNYPLTKQLSLFETQHQLEQEVVLSSKLPQFSFDAQATYQSDVIAVPIPNSTIKPINKDQYRATLSVNQLIYNGGATDASLNVKSSQLKTKQKQVEVNLYQLKQHINQLYFSILLAQETDLLLQSKQTLLEVKLSEVISGIKYGVLLPASDKVLKVELIKIKKQLKDIESNKVTLIETLSSIIGHHLDPSTTFQNTLIETITTTELTRPELELFQLKKDEIESNEAVIAKQNSPKLLGFATGGYGNPGLNMLDNSFQPFYSLSVKLNWNVFDWNSNKKLREALSINKDIIDTETETFKLNTNTELNQQLNEIKRIEAFIASDLEIINLRKEVLKSADSQLKNGVITSSAYITELTNLYEDENTLIKHKIQLQLAKANYNVIKGH
ncbi:outer membrane protein TolC [Gelidibacter sediminis]|uniref:Outer membrane protein TolC n=1 Tax=Gelidibacter sediminis TaxID=1608710 RepID=A0A4R7PZK9_9FLAO|nr:TolC family protein [Gelidibacter sediminis]TDU40473.1 outer membrane protein TolC [Gelidibacter sediminis]